MATLSDLEKLRVLLPHWIAHNAEHAAEFRRWAAVAAAAQADIEAAAANLEAANTALERALQALGGPLDSREAGRDHHAGDGA